RKVWTDGGSVLMIDILPNAKDIDASGPRTYYSQESASPEEHKPFIRAGQVHALDYHGVDRGARDMFTPPQCKLGNRTCMIVCHRNERAFMFVAMRDPINDTFWVQSYKSDRMRVWPTQSTQFRQAMRKEAKYA